MRRRGPLEHRPVGTGAGGAAGLRHRAAARSGAVEGEARRLGAEAHRQLRRTRPTSTGAPGSPQLLFVVEQEGEIEVLRNGRRLGQPFLDIRGSSAPVASGACSRSPFRPTTRRAAASTSITRTTPATSASTNSGGRARPGPIAGSRRGVIEIPHPVNANHNGGQLQFLGDLLYFGTGDGGRAAIRPTTPRTRRACSASCSASTRGRAADGPTRFPPTTPSSASRAATRSTPTACATPSASPSTRPAPSSPGSRSATSARTASRSSTTPPSPPPAAPTSAGTPSRATAATTKKKATRPTPATRPSRSWPTAAAATAAPARSSAATWSARAVQPSLRGRYLYADYCSGVLRSLVPHLRRASSDRKPGLTVASPTSFGEDGRGRIYVSSQEGPVFRLVSR